MSTICCTTGYSFFEVWTLVHTAFWIFVGSTLWAFHLNRWLALVSGLLLALAWELVEHVMAPAHPEIWKDPESWWNAWLSDPLTCIVAVLSIYWLLDHRPRKRS